MRSFAHIVNPILVKETSDLYLAQPVTFETMRRAQARAEATGKIKVDLYTAQYPEDHPVVPEDFIRTPDLERSVRDVVRFKVPRKLPLLGDILRRLYDASEAEYLIYTNVDIALQPHFYIEADRIAEEGYGAFIINRRTVPATKEQAANLEWLYAQKGERHGGYDCFVFRKPLLEKIDLRHICIGAPGVGRSLRCALEALAKRFKIFEDLYLTFHINNDGFWKTSQACRLLRYNIREALGVLDALEAAGHAVSAEEKKILKHVFNRHRSWYMKLLRLKIK